MTKDEGILTYCGECKRNTLCHLSHKIHSVILLDDISRFQRQMTRIKINGKILSEMTFQEAYPVVIRLLIEGRCPVVR